LAQPAVLATSKPVNVQSAIFFMFLISKQQAQLARLQMFPHRNAVGNVHHALVAGAPQRRFFATLAAADAGRERM
jgi:hypothetical protein